MKNKIILIAFVQFLFCSLNAQESTQDKQDRLAWEKCKVKTITTTETDYSYFGTKPQPEKPFLTSKSTCNKNGTIAIAKTYNKRGTLESWYSFEYEKAAIPKRMTVYNEDGTVNIKAIIKNYYDSLGRHSEASSFLNDTLFLGKNLYAYDNNGNWIAENIYEADPNDRKKMRLTSSESYKYDNKGRTVEATSHEEGSSSDLSTTFKYGENGKVSEKNNGYIGVYTYGANGLCTSIKYYNTSNVLQYVVAYTYEYYTN